MIPIFRPTIKRKDMDGVLTCMVTDLIGPGNLSNEFETLVAKYLDVHGGISFSSYYIALMVAVETLGLEPGDSVVISALSPAIYLNILEEEGLVPLIADVDINSGVLCPQEVEKALEKGPKAILLHYNQGIIPDIDALLKFEIPIIEDISHALGGSVDEKKAGSFGDVTVLSLEPDNIITTGGGGLVLAKDKMLFSKLKKVKEVSKGSLLLPDMNASLGLIQLKELDQFLERRKNIFGSFNQALMKSRHKTFLQEKECDRIHHSFPIILSSGLKEAQKYCRKKNIETLQAFLETVVAYNEEEQKNCPNARKLMRRTLLFPLYPMLSKTNVNNISRVIGTLP